MAVYKPISRVTVAVNVRPVSQRTRGARMVEGGSAGRCPFELLQLEDGRVIVALVDGDTVAEVSLGELFGAMRAAVERARAEAAGDGR